MGRTSFLFAAKLQKSSEIWAFFLDKMARMKDNVGKRS